MVAEDLPVQAVEVAVVDYSFCLTNNNYQMVGNRKVGAKENLHQESPKMDLEAEEPHNLMLGVEGNNLEMNYQVEEEEVEVEVQLKLVFMVFLEMV